MALGYYFHPESMSAQQYDRVIQKLDEAGAAARRFVPDVDAGEVVDEPSWLRGHTKPPIRSF